MLQRLYQSYLDPQGFVAKPFLATSVATATVQAWYGASERQARALACSQTCASLSMLEALETIGAGRYAIHVSVAAAKAPQVVCDSSSVRGGYPILAVAGLN